MLTEASLMTSEPPRGGSSLHRSVLLQETLDLLAPGRGSTAVDCTVGMGGHSRALLEAVGPAGRVVGIDRDRESLDLAQGELRDFGDCFLPVHADFRELPGVLRELGIRSVETVLADFGFSSYQLDSPERGFSFAMDGPLDMRMDRSSGPTAAELLNGLEEAELSRILREFGEERAARSIARALIAQRRRRPFRRTLELSRIVQMSSGRKRAFRIHPATRTFQALRIAVNRELEGLDAFVGHACGALAPGGRAAFISFHSLEDRIVKRTLRSLSPRCLCPPGLPRCVCGTPGLVEALTRKAVRPGKEEVLRNPRSRSARLRVVRRLPGPAAIAPEHR